MNDYRGLVVQCARRFFPHLLTRNAEDNILEASQTAWIIAQSGVDSIRAVNRACYAVSRDLGFARNSGKREDGGAIVGEPWVNRRIEMRPDTRYRKNLDKTAFRAWRKRASLKASQQGLSLTA